MVTVFFILLLSKETVIFFWIFLNSSVEHFKRNKICDLSSYLINTILQDHNFTFKFI